MVGQAAARTTDGPIRVLHRNHAARRVVGAFAIFNLMVEGEYGDRYLAIVDGTVDAFQHGAVIATRSRGDGVGETALLRDVPRTATVRARGPVHALAIAKDDFLIAVTGHPATHAVAADLAARRVVDGTDDN